MKPSKRLSLRRDVATDLTTDELRHLAAANNNTPLCVTQWVTVCRECPSDPIMGCTILHPTEQQTCIC